MTRVSFVAEQTWADYPATLAAGWSTPVVAAAALGTAALATLTYGMVVPQSRLLLPVLSRALDATAPRVGLTFDDGPWPGSTEVILDVLKEHKVSAAFFVIGSNVEKWPMLVQRMHDDGHFVGNHSFDHHRLGSLRGLSYWRDQIRRTDEMVRSIVGHRPALFRPPMGIKTPPLAAALRESGHKTIAWSCRGFDGVTTAPAQIVRNIGTKIRAGEIALLHDGRDPRSRRDVRVTAAALPEIIRLTRARRLEFAPLTSLLPITPYRQPD